MQDEPEESPELAWYRNPDLSIVPHWAAIAVTGVIYAPVIPLGHLPDLYLVPETFLETDPSFKAAIAESFRSSGLAEKQNDATIEHPQYLLFAINHCI
jgi:hypothetical protein